MLRDARLNFGDETFASLSSATINADNYVDLEAHRTVNFRTSTSSASSSVLTPDIGENGMLEFNAKVLTILASTSSATLNVRLHHHTAATSGVSTIVTSGAVLMSTTAVALDATNKAAGYSWIRARVPAGTVNRYLAVSFVAASGAIATGKISTWIAGPSETPK